MKTLCQIVLNRKRIGTTSSEYEMISQGSFPLGDSDWAAKKIFTDAIKILKLNNVSYLTLWFAIVCVFEDDNIAQN